MRGAPRYFANLGKSGGLSLLCLLFIKINLERSTINNWSCNRQNKKTILFFCLSLFWAKTSFPSPWAVYYRRICSLMLKVSGSAPWLDPTQNNGKIISKIVKITLDKYVVVLYNVSCK